MTTFAEECYSCSIRLGVKGVRGVTFGHLFCGSFTNVLQNGKSGLVITPNL
jgi:hypothetical protein